MESQKYHFCVHYLIDRTVCILAFPSFVNMLTLHFASLLDVLFLQCDLQEYTFQVVSFQIERTISLSRIAKVLNLISSCNLHPRTKELCWRFLDSRLLATLPRLCDVSGCFGTGRPQREQKG